MTDNFEINLQTPSNEESLESLTQGLDPETSKALEQVEGEVFVDMTRRNIRRLGREARKSERRQKRKDVKATGSKAERRSVRQEFRRDKKEIKSDRDILMGTFDPLRAFNPRIKVEQGEDGVSRHSVLIDRPTSEAEIARLNAILVRECAKRRRELQMLRQAGAAQHQITQAEKEFDILSGLITEMRVNGNTDTYEAHIRAQHQENEAAASTGGGSRSRPVGGSGLTSTSMFDSWNGAQKHRLGRVATIGAAVLTVVGLYKAIFKKDKGWQSFLSVMGGLGLAAYVHGGKFKFPWDMVKEGLNGGYTYDVLAGNFGLEGDEISDSPTPGREIESLAVSQAGSVLAGIPYSQLHAAKFIKVEDGTVLLDGTGDECTLAQYWIRKGNERKAQIAQGIYEQQSDGVYGLDESLTIMGERRRVIEGADSNRKIDKGVTGFRNREEDLTEYMNTNNLLFASQDNQLVNDYYAGKVGVTMDDLTSHFDEVFVKKEEAESRYIPLYTPELQKEALAEMGKLRHHFKTIPANVFKGLIEFNPGTSVAMMNRDELEKNHPTISARFTTQRMKEELELSMAIFFGQVMAFPDEGGINLLLDEYGSNQMENFFKDYDIILRNYEALGRYCNANKLIANPDANEDIATFIKDKALDTPTKRTAALEVLFAGGSMEYHTNGHEMTEGIDPTSAEVKNHLNSLKKATFLSREPNFDEQITEVATYAAGYNNKLKDVMPMSGIFEVTSTTLSWNSYDTSTSITKSGRGYSFKSSNERSGFPNTMQCETMLEAFQMAHLTNMLLGTHNHEAKRSDPWKRNGDHMEFKRNDSVLDFAGDARRSLGSRKEMKKSVMGNIARDVTSEEGIKNYYDVLLKTGNGEKYRRYLNSMGIRHEDQGSNIDLLTSKKALVADTIERYNETHQEKIKYDTNTQGGEMRLYVDSYTYDGATVDNEIHINLIDNSIGENMPFGMIGLEQSTEVAIRLLRVKAITEYLARVGHKEVTELPAEVRTFLKDNLGTHKVPIIHSNGEVAKDRDGNIMMKDTNTYEALESGVIDIGTAIRELIIGAFGVVGMVINVEATWFRAILKAIGLAEGALQRTLGKIENGIDRVDKKTN